MGVVAAACTALGALACASGTATGGAMGAATGAATGAAALPAPAVSDTATQPGLVPPGLGTLRQEDVTLEVSLVGGVTARALPLDESVIRVLAPDTYRALRDQLAARRPQLSEIARRYGYERYSVWRVTFFGSEQGEARFSPQEVIVTNAGRDFRPLDIVPLTPGFGEQRLRQRAQQSALYVFDGALDVNQPSLVVAIQGIQNDGWGTSILPRVERERALVRTRAARSATPARPG